MAEGAAAVDRAILLIPPDCDLRGLTRQATLGLYRLQPAGTSRRRSTFVDTPDLALTRAGAALRLQRHASRWQAVFTRPGHSAAAPDELEAVTVSPPKPPHLRLVLTPGPLRTALCAWAAGRPLQAMLVLDVHRRRIGVHAANEDLIAELLLDRVHAYAPEDQQTPATPSGAFEQLTIERRNGQTRDMTRLLHLVSETFHLATPDASPIERGLALLGRPVPPACAEPRVAFDDTVQSAARTIVGRHLGRLRQQDAGTRIGEDPEALHDLRVALRRLRAAVRVFAPTFPPRWREHLISEMHWLGQITGPVRDLDVQLARIQLYGRALPTGHRAGLTALRTYMDAERTRQRAELLAGLDSRRYFRLLLRLEGFALGRSHTHSRDAAAHEPITQAGAQHVRRAWRRLRRRGNKIKGAPAPEDLHALRIRAKRLRYLLEFLQELTGKRGRTLVKRLVRLQDLLGAYHDAVVTAEFVHRYAEGPGTQLGAAGLLTLGALTNAALRIADEHCREFHQTWRRFSRKRTCNEFRALVRQLRSISPGVAPAAIDTATPAMAAPPVPRSAAH